MIAEVNQICDPRWKETGERRSKGGGQSGGTRLRRDCCRTQTAKEEKPNKGTMIVDATCVPSDIRFPTDVSLIIRGTGEVRAAD